MAHRRPRAAAGAAVGRASRGAVSSSLLLCVAVLVCATTGVVVAQTPTPAPGPITPAQCWQVNPFWSNATCTSLYGQPATDFFSPLPWNDVPAYQTCVQQRCVCTQLRANTSFTPSGLYCGDAANGFTESGFVTCNEMLSCYATFWRCITDAVMQRYLAGVQLSASESAVVNEIRVHGNTPGQSFQQTGLFDSCRFLTCQAASSRQSCGLQTCMPSYSQCYEYMRPPPLPYRHQLCTQGCRAGLLLMALTIAAISFAMCCCACCPPRVRAVDPMFGKNGSNANNSSGNGSHKPAPISP